MKHVARMLLAVSICPLAFSQSMEILGVQFKLGMTREEAFAAIKKTGIKPQVTPVNELVLVAPGEGRQLYGSLSFDLKDKLIHIRKQIRAFRASEDPADLAQVLYTVLDNAQRVHGPAAAVESEAGRTPNIAVESVRISYGPYYYQLALEYGVGRSQGQRRVVLYEGLQQK